MHAVSETVVISQTLLLLQEHLDYDTVSKQAPVITEAVSKTLEEIIVRCTHYHTFYLVGYHLVT